MAEGKRLTSPSSSASVLDWTIIMSSGELFRSLKDLKQPSFLLTYCFAVLVN